MIYKEKKAKKKKVRKPKKNRRAGSFREKKKNPTTL